MITMTAIKKVTQSIKIRCDLTCTYTHADFILNDKEIIIYSDAFDNMTVELQ